MCAVRRALMLTLAAAALPTAGPAQEIGLAIGAGQVTGEGGGSQPALTLAPTAAWGGRSAAAAVGGEFRFPGTGEVIGAAGVSLRAWTAGRGAGFALGVDGVTHGASSGSRAFGVSLSPQVGYAGQAWSVAAGPSIGIGARHAARGAPAPGLLPGIGPRPAGGYEARSVHGLVAELRAGAGPLRWSGLWRTSTAGTAHWRDLQAELVLEADRVALALEGGVRSGAVAEEWAGLRAAAQLTPGVALLARAGRHAADPLTGMGAGTRAEVGVQLRTGRSAASRTRPATSPPVPPDGRVRLVLRAGRGAIVELAADWTGWEPVPVEESEPGLYAVAVRLPPGTHRFAFLVDGRWRTPEGYATEPDGYGGRHALVRVAG